MKNILNNKGQGLLEAMAGITIIIIGLTGILAIGYGSMMSNYEAQTRVVAANLAREGVEATHNIRDSNWLGANLWDDGLHNAADYNGVPILDCLTGRWQINFTPNDILSDVAKVYQYTAENYNNLFVQADSQPANTSEVPFKRFITLRAICYDGSAESIEDSAACSTGNKIGVRMSVEVLWTEHSRTHNLTVEDSVYDWR